ncbi:N-acetylmuramoyl-L-alanine amidase [Desulfopila aestuarii]|uniref:N-acetylmuramoyl-L-alanine amidase n=1 Tax=Desulfopila aestuarii TaxID=231440 RepID=UPI0013563D0E|nr:N-acetylmuramoyl-L-alanine amidase [Desulfopila aestuarii]
MLLLLFLQVIIPANLVFSSSLDKPAIEDSISQRYSEAKFYFNELLTNDTISQKVENWERGAQNFRRIYLADPQSEQAPACLFMLGQIYAYMFQRFHNVSDLDESISYYKDVARLFPENRLADDSYYAMGLLYLKGKQDPDQAAQQFSKIVQDYQSGDMHPQAAEMLKQLSTDHNVALPTVMVGNSGLSKLNYILPVKYWSSDDYTRIVIMASGPVNYREELLDGSEGKPRRLYIDFQSSYIEPQYREPLKIEDGLLQQVRTAQFSKDTVRVVLDIESIDSYRIYSLPEPFRVVVDVRGKSVANNQKKLTKPAPVKTPDTIVAIPPATAKPIVIHPERRKVLAAEQHRGKMILKSNNSKVVALMPELLAPSLAQQLGLKVKRIVLDPGHGGKDPGALANGLQEKDIVLKFAQQLKPAIEKEIGCEVLLTRDIDTFISLEERTAIANTQNADLFISIHLNAHPSPKVRGLETYYLNLSTNAEAMRVAAMENATSTNQMSDLQDILQDIMQNSKITESSRLAEQVHGTLVAGLAQKSFGDVQNLGVKQAPFYVLIGAQMPAILMELAFISNEEDVQNLKSDAYLSAMAHEIALGVQAYVNSATAKL